ncbi:MAG: PSD1 and planctomycete cytochrome C domain-containing protein [Pirellulales bacterium]
MTAMRIPLPPSFAITLAVLTLSGSNLAQAAEPPVPDRVEFNRDVRPILSDHCFVCHGPDAGRREADLRLDRRDVALQQQAIVPGQPAQSKLVSRITATDDDERMPPASFNKDLTPRQKAILQRWIEQGAEYQQHWAYEPPVKADVPPGAPGIDTLVQRRLAERGWQRSARADRRTLIRRLSLDLWGLPPTPERVAEFARDERPDAYAILVDELLRSPHYGERMAQNWLDTVRYADTIGYHSDNPRNVWPYRDWVIRSFRDNQPFDRFTLEQIAGDLLPDASNETRVASAFNRLVLSTEEGGAQPKDYEARMLTDRVRAIGTAWLGQTTGCAQCHDHKYDPFTMRDFYSLGAFFADVQETAVGRREEGMPVVGPEDAAALVQLDAAVAAARAAQPPDKVAVQQAERARQAWLADRPHCLVTVAASPKRTVRILPRGNWQDESGPVVRPALPHYLPQPAADDRELTRLDLARWLVSRDNPLTARTVMNRLWKHFFGTGLSRVLDDLGAQGEPPVNGPLLDWLACEFMDSGWDFRHMVRAIVLSETYQQVSTAPAELRAADPLNRQLARQTPFRLDAEQVRDQALAVSGLLSRRIGGPSVKPYQPLGYWDNLNFPTRLYVADRGESQYRRGLYTWWQRSFLHPSLLAFDAPSREECCAERNRSNIPQQALVLLNDPTYVEAARALAARVLTESPATFAARVDRAWQLTLQRAPRPDEVATISRLLEQQRATYEADPAAASEWLKVGDTPPPAGIEPLELAAWAHVARVLLNLHETITRS